MIRVTWVSVNMAPQSESDGRGLTCMIVTIQEAGWESFSEDDTPKPPAKRPTPSSTPASSGAKPKKSVGKGAQGSIMSFFAKK